MQERVVFEVNGVEYGGLKSVTINKSVAMVAGQFSVQYTELWPGREDPWPILPHSPCRILLGSNVLINGYVDKLPIEFSTQSHALCAAGRDRTGQLVDCDPQPTPGEFRNTNLEKLARTFANPLGLSVDMAPGLHRLQTIDAVRLSAGQSSYRALEEQARKDNVLLGSTSSGGLRLFCPGYERATVPLIFGQNIESGILENDWSNRYSHYMVDGQDQGFDSLPGTAAQVRGEAFDKSVSLPRLKRFRADSGMDNVAAGKRADWEATTRAARSVSLVIPMRGWRQNPDDTNSELWREGLLVDVDIPKVKISEELLIESVDYTFRGNKFGCVLHLTRPDAWIPKPPNPDKDPLSGEGLPELYG